MRSRKSVKKKIQLYGWSLFIFKPKNKIRKAISFIIQNNFFENFIIFLIVISSITLAIENPLMDPDSTFVNVLFIIDTILTSIFILEAILKIITHGFMFWGKNSYIRNGWNIIDFIIIIFSLLSFAFNNQVRALKAIRLLRILKPLRVISRNEGLKVAVQALLISIPNIGNVLIISLLFFIIFAIICVNFFKGQFFYCYNTNTDEYETIISSLNGNPINNQRDWLDNGSLWINNDANFDDVLHGILALFEMSTTEGWVEYMYLSGATNGIGNQPKRQTNVWVPIFFIIFMLFGSLFILNLFVGVVIGTFKTEKENIGKNFCLPVIKKNG